MAMIRDASVARLKSRFYTFGSFESFASHIPIIPFERSRPAADAAREVEVGLVACGLR